MICQYCGGQVYWQGPLSDPMHAHTECQQCGRINCQLPEPEPDEDEDLVEDEIEGAAI